MNARKSNAPSICCVALTANAANRRGVMLPVALICCLVCALILTAMIGEVARRIRVIRSSERAAQCDWLAQSALRKARLRLRDDPAYVGDAWVLAEGEPLPQAARAEIQVERRGDSHVVTVSAEYPADTVDSIRRRLQATWPIASAEREAGSSPPAPEESFHEPPSPGDRPPAPPTSPGDVR